MPPRPASPARAAPASERDRRAEPARERLLVSGLRLFAQQGFAKTSTREIAQAAGVNVSAIRYYFGDKAGLYRAAFCEPLGEPHNEIGRLAATDSLPEALEAFYRTFLAPLKLGEVAQHCMRLHFREMVEPTGLWAQEVEQAIKPAHAGLVAMLVRHLGLRSADDEVHRLCFAIVGLGVHVVVGREVFQAIRPNLVATPAAIDRMVRRLADYAQALVEAERARRAARKGSRHK